jgi:hypothetical protein
MIIMGTRLIDTEIMDRIHECKDDSTEFIEEELMSSLGHEVRKLYPNLVIETKKEAGVSNFSFRIHTHTDKEMGEALNLIKELRNSDDKDKKEKIYDSIRKILR